MSDAPTALLALDWGSSALRAFRLGAAGDVIEQRASADGASRLQGGAPVFEAALRRLARDWLAPGVPVLACGMVGSAHGWREAPYADCPIALDALHRHLVTVQTGDGLRVHIVPGVTCRDDAGLPDVMRGEETQLVGLQAVQPALGERATVVMPGTHSKWARMRDGRLQRFATRMTGELFALLREHSVLARLMADGAAFDAGAFDRGVAVARAAQGADLARLLFGVRTLGLAGELPAAAAADYLSGLLVGAELASALPNEHDAAAPIALVGEPALCRRYARALGAWGLQALEFGQPLAAPGLWRLARAAALA